MEGYIARFNQETRKHETRARRGCDRLLRLRCGNGVYYRWSGALQCLGQSCASGSCSQLALNRQILTADCGRLRLTPDWLMHAFAPCGTRCVNWECILSTSAADQLGQR